MCVYLSIIMKTMILYLVVNDKPTYIGPVDIYLFFVRFLTIHKYLMSIL